MSRSSLPKKTRLAANPVDGHWRQEITREQPALISERGVRCYFVVKNNGPDDVLLYAEYGEEFQLRPGAVRVTYAHGIIRVENRGQKSALIEFEILPLLPK